MMNEESLDYAWKWFDFHGKQRVDTIRLFLIVFGVLTASYIKAFTDKMFLISFVCSILLIVSTFAFYRLDRRNRGLVRVGEAYLIEAEQKLCTEVGSTTIMLLQNAEVKEYKYFCSYSEIFFIFFLVTGLVGVAQFIFSVYFIFQSIGIDLIGCLPNII